MAIHYLCERGRGGQSAASLETNSSYKNTPSDYSIKGKKMKVPELENIENVQQNNIHLAEALGNSDQTILVAFFVSTAGPKGFGGSMGPLLKMMFTHAWGLDFLL